MGAATVEPHGGDADDIHVTARAVPREGVDATGPRAVAIFGSFRYGQYYEDLLSGVVAAADAADGSVIAVQTSVGVLPSGFTEGGQAVSRAAWDHFDAAIVVLEAVPLEYVAQLRAAGKFVVAIGQQLRGAHAAVTLDNAGGVGDALAHLAGHGHTDIGFIAPTWQADAVERYAAYRTHMARLGLVALPVMGADLPARLSLDQQGYLAAQRFVSDGRTCTAVMVAPDLIALGFIRGLREAGVNVPVDVAVVGVDDVDEAAVSAPPLATVAISFERVGETAFGVAMRGGRGEAMTGSYVVAQHFVPRDSCGCYAGAAAEGVAGGGSAVDRFAGALARAAADTALVASLDTECVDRLAHEIGTFLTTPAPAAGPGDVAKVLAARVNALCPLDRSVQAALRAIRVLALELADSAVASDPAAAGSLTSATLDVCDAIRSGQLQRRMTEYVDLKRMQVTQHFIGNSLLGRDRGELRSLAWLQQTHADAGALALWQPPGQAARVSLTGVYDRAPGDQARRPDLPVSASAVEAFPPPWMLRDDTGTGRLVVVNQVRFEDSDWGVLAVAGGRALQQSLVQETFQQWSVLMSASLDQEKADADLARQAGELATAYDKEMRLLEEVRISEERYALAAEAARDALWDWDLSTGKVFYSNDWKALLGYRDNEIGNTPQEWLDRVHTDDHPLVSHLLRQVADGVEEFVEFEHRLRVSTGEYRWMACSGRTVLEGGQPVRLVGSISDVTVRRLLQDQLRHEALYDGLTGLAKATLFHDRVNQAMELGKRRVDYWFAVLFVDLDGFKAINDSFGHSAGDELLASVASRLMESLRKNDTAARIGGDEFAILLTDVGHVGELPLIIARIKSVISAPHDIGGHVAQVTASIGVAVSLDGYTSPQAMLHEADTAMYAAKRRSKEAASLASSRPMSP